jgi:hypothetical protein
VAKFFASSFKPSFGQKTKEAPIGSWLQDPFFFEVEHLHHYVYIPYLNSKDSKSATG